MATYVLVHGAWHGGWCWERVSAALEANGHTVVTPDLPGHGADTTPIATVTLPAAAERIAEVVRAQDGPVVLAGHSMGGIIVTQAAELVPDRIASLAYVTAFLPNDGDALAALASADDPVVLNLQVDEAAGTATVASEVLQDVFFGTCSDEDAAWAIGQLCPEALALIGTPVALGDARAAAIPRDYVHALRDRAIDYGKQKEMVAASAVPLRSVVEIDSDHSPFLCAPDELVAHLEAFAG